VGEILYSTKPTHSTNASSLVVGTAGQNLSIVKLEIRIAIICYGKKYP